MVSTLVSYPWLERLNIRELVAISRMPVLKFWDFAFLAFYKLG